MGASVTSNLQQLQEPPNRHKKPFLANLPFTKSNFSSVDYNSWKLDQSTLSTMAFHNDKDLLSKNLHKLKKGKKKGPSKLLLTDVYYGHNLQSTVLRGSKPGEMGSFQHQLSGFSLPQFESPKNQFSSNRGMLERFKGAGAVEDEVNERHCTSRVVENDKKSVQREIRFSTQESQDGDNANLAASIRKFRAIGMPQSTKNNRRDKKFYSEVNEIFERSKSSNNVKLELLRKKYARKPKIDPKMTKTGKILSGGEVKLRAARATFWEQRVKSTQKNVARRQGFRRLKAKTQNGNIQFSELEFSTEERRKLLGTQSFKNNSFYNKIKRFGSTENLQSKNDPNSKNSVKNQFGSIGELSSRQLDLEAPSSTSKKLKIDVDLLPMFRTGRKSKKPLKPKFGSETKHIKGKSIKGGIKPLLASGYNLPLKSNRFLTEESEEAIADFRDNSYPFQFSRATQKLRKGKRIQRPTEMKSQQVEGSRPQKSKNKGKRRDTKRTKGGTRRRDGPSVEDPSADVDVHEFLNNSMDDTLIHQNNQNLNPKPKKPRLSVQISHKGSQRRPKGRREDTELRSQTEHHLAPKPTKSVKKGSKRGKTRKSKTLEGDDHEDSDSEFFRSYYDNYKYNDFNEEVLLKVEESKLRDIQRRLENSELSCSRVFWEMDPLKMMKEELKMKILKTKPPVKTIRLTDGRKLRIKPNHQINELVYLVNSLDPNDDHDYVGYADMPQAEPDELPSYRRAIGSPRSTLRAFDTLNSFENSQRGLARMMLSPINSAYSRQYTRNSPEQGKTISGFNKKKKMTLSKFMSRELPTIKMDLLGSEGEEEELGSEAVSEQSRYPITKSSKNHLLGLVEEIEENSEESLESDSNGRMVTGGTLESPKESSGVLESQIVSAETTSQEERVNEAKSKLSGKFIQSCENLVKNLRKIKEITRNDDLLYKFFVKISGRNSAFLHCFFDSEKRLDPKMTADKLIEVFRTTPKKIKTVKKVILQFPLSQKQFVDKAVAEGIKNSRKIKSMLKRLKQEKLTEMGYLGVNSAEFGLIPAIAESLKKVLEDIQKDIVTRLIDDVIFRNNLANQHAFKLKKQAKDYFEENNEKTGRMEHRSLCYPKPYFIKPALDLKNPFREERELKIYEKAKDYEEAVDVYFKKASMLLEPLVLQHDRVIKDLGIDR